MEEPNKPNNFGDDFYFWLAVAVGAFIVAVAWIFRHDNTERVYKSELAEKYGVSSNLLMKWGKFFCPLKVRLFYIGSKIKRVRVGYFEKYLGDPDERPKNLKGEPIWTKKEICKALFIEGTTLARRINEIEEPKSVIKMTRKAFRGTRKFPPHHVKLILDYMGSKGYEIKK